jgi:hypothetical protein
MLHGIRDIGEGIVSKEFRSLAQIGSLRIKKLLKLSLLPFQLLLLSLQISSGLPVLDVIGMHDKYNEVDVQVEFQFLAVIVRIFHLFGNESIPQLEEVPLEAIVEGLRQPIQKLIRVAWQLLVQALL